MDIKYLKKMLATPVIDDEENEGITEEAISNIENEISQRFPVAFREFLFLGGENANMIADMNHQVQSFVDGEQYWKEMQENCQKELNRTGVKLEKPFWAFADLDAGEQFHFFYFDEGDDPPVYYYCSYHDNEDFTETYAGVIKTDEHFSDYVNLHIDDKKKYGY